MTACFLWGIPFYLGPTLEYCRDGPKCLDVRVQLGHAFSWGVFFFFLNGFKA